MLCFFNGFSQVDQVPIDWRVNQGTKLFFSIPPLIDLEGMMIQAGIEYPISEKFALKHLAAYYLYANELKDPGKLDGFRIGTTAKVYLREKQSMNSTYFGLSAFWKNAVYEGVQFFPQNEIPVWKRTDFSNIYNIIGFYVNFGNSRKFENHVFTNIGFMIGPEYVHIQWIDVPDNISYIPNVPQPDLLYEINGPGGGWRFMLRLVADIGYSF